MTFLLLILECSGDTSTNPKGQENKMLSTETITSSGGSVKTDRLEIIIPPGAFSTSQEIKISESTDDNLFGTYAISDFFVLDGLPTEFTGPITIKIKSSGTISDSTYISVGEQNFISSLNDETTAYHLINAKDSSGVIIAEIPPMVNQVLWKISYNSSIEEDKLSINLGAIAGYVSYKSPQGHFVINTPSSAITQAYDLAKYLETAYSKFKDIGFNYSNRTKWPVDVTIKPLNSKKNDVYGYSINSMWGNNYGYMEFNFDKTDDAENMKVTAGHEFFHLVQALYDPRYGYSKAKSPMPNYWLDEASSVWSESFFSSQSNYLSPIFSDNVFDVFKGAKTGNDKSTSEQYGYGMASLIQYITKKYGDSKLVDIYDNISNGNTPFHSVSQVFPVDIEMSWHSFLQSLLTFDLYSGDTFRPAVLLSYTTGEHQKFIINSVSDSLKVYNSKLSDLSATLFSVDNRFTDMSDDAILEFTCKGWNFQLYKVNSNSSEMIESGKDRLTVDHFKQLTEDGYKIMAALYNDNYNSPFENSKEYKMEIRVKKPPKKIISVKFDFAFTGTYQTREGTSTYYDTFWNDGYTDNTTTQINGNTVSVQENYTDTYNNIVVTTELVFDDIDNPENIVSIKCNETDYYIPGQSNKVRSAEAINIPLMQVYDNGTREYFCDGNISQNLLNLKYVETDNNNSITKQLLSYESEGSIQVMIYYEQ